MSKQTKYVLLKLCLQCMSRNLAKQSICGECGFLMTEQIKDYNLPKANKRYEEMHHYRN